MRKILCVVAASILVSVYVVPPVRFFVNHHIVTADSQYQQELAARAQKEIDDCIKAGR